MVKCYQCGNVYDEEFNICPLCGAPYDPARQTPFAMNDSDDQQPQPPDSQQVQPLTPAPQQMQPPTQPQPEKKKSKAKTAVILTLAAVVAVGGAVCATLFFTGSFKGSSDGKSGSADPTAASVASDAGQESVKEQNDVPASPEAMNKLVGIIDEAKGVYSDSLKKYGEIDASSDPKNAYSSRKEVLRKASSDLKALRDKALETEGLDGKLKSVSSEFFGMLISAEDNYSDITSMFSDYYKLNFTIGGRKEVNINNDEERQGFLDEMKALENNNKQVFDSAKVPVSYENEWNSLKKAFDALPQIREKLQIAVEKTDSLRYYSCGVLAQRFENANKKVYKDLVNAMNGERDFVVRQQESAYELADEIKAYSEMDENSRQSYEFRKIKTNTIKIDYECTDKIYPALYNTYDAFAIIKTGCLSGSRSVLVEAEIPGFTQKFRQTYNLTTAYQTIRIKPAALTEKIDLSKARAAQMNVSIYTENGRDLLSSKTFDIELKSINDFEWYSDEFGFSTPDNILCYLMPDADEVDVLKRNAIDYIKKITGGAIDSFAGYQEISGSHYYDTYVQAAGIMRALYESGVRYDMSSFSISGSNQRIKRPDEVLQKKSGLCIETSLVVASALQSANMHAFIIIPPGHAQVAVEIWNDGLGKGEYFLIETTSLEESNNNDQIYKTYADELIKGTALYGDYPIVYLNEDQWSEYLSQCDYIIDCNDSTTLGLTRF